MIGIEFLKFDIFNPSSKCANEVSNYEPFEAVIWPEESWDMGLSIREIAIQIGFVLTDLRIAHFMILSEFINFASKPQNIKNCIFEPPMYHPPMSPFSYTFTKKYKIRYTKRFLSLFLSWRRDGRVDIKENPHFNRFESAKLKSNHGLEEKKLIR